MDPASGAADAAPSPVPAVAPGSGTGRAASASNGTGASHKPPRQPKVCTKCGKRIEGGQFVRAVGCHYHLECFRCQASAGFAARVPHATLAAARTLAGTLAGTLFRTPAGTPAGAPARRSSSSSSSVGRPRGLLQHHNDCDQVVADKFFPVTEDGVTRIYCETDYFRRLDLICAKCGLALRGPYINALNKKYHMEHFTCSVCPTAFRQHDSYYERDGQVFCGYHYSIFHAAKCGGCNTAVLKNFVEINKDRVAKQWHPPCYMIFKLWNAQLCLPDQRGEEAPGAPRDPEAEVHKQQVMVEWAERILQVLSAFEESAAACISEMLLHFSNENNLQCVLQAARFIQHVDILFSTIESINRRLIALNDNSTLQTKEPKQLVKKIFYFFTNLSGHETLVRQRATLGLIQQVTSLAHTLKKVIRTAFAGSLRLVSLENDLSGRDIPLALCVADVCGC
nr:hypothetical protein HK105_001400 [Polyrhizophydium stewartii]